jgi:hypothetical protein
VFTALPPPPPIPMTLIRAFRLNSSTNSNISIPPYTTVMRSVSVSEKITEPIRHSMLYLC